MSMSRRVFGLLLLVLVVGPAAPAADDKKKPDDAPKEETVVAYASKTHGAVEVKNAAKNPVDWFDVLKDGKRAFAGNPKLLNNVQELAPGEYVVDVNRTQRTVTIEPGKKIVLWTGELVVEGKPDTAYWYPMQGKERRITANPPILNKPRALFAGSYTVFVHVSVAMDDANLGKAEVKPGKKTVLKH